MIDAQCAKFVVHVEKAGVNVLYCLEDDQATPAFAVGQKRVSLEVRARTERLVV